MQAKRSDYIDSFGNPIQARRLYNIRPESGSYFAIIPIGRPSNVQNVWFCENIYPLEGSNSRYPLTPLQATACQPIQPERLLEYLVSYEQSIQSLRNKISKIKPWGKELIGQDGLFSSINLNQLVEDGTFKLVPGMIPYLRKAVDDYKQDVIRKLSRKG